jgi:glyoxylase-like metal-dependent hydrolase (beta-lactamase superfamily II)
MSELLPGVFLVDGVGAPGRPGTVNVSLLVAQNGTATLVDAGFPGVMQRLTATLEEAGILASDVRRVIVTHYHPDHTSGLPEVLAATGAEVWAHADDADIIDGTKPRPVPPGLPSGAPRPAFVAEPVRVDLRLIGDEVLDILGGCRIIHTPGHTAGHISLLLPAHSLLIAGDILRYEDGLVTRAPEKFTADAETNEESLRALAKLEFERLLPYHGEFLGEGASTQMRHDLGPG